MTDDEVRKLEKGVDFRVSRESVDRMNRALIDNINATVGEDDILWTLGDWSFPSNYKTAMYIRSQLRCQNIFKVFGNHDSPQIAQVFDRPTDLGSRKKEALFLNDKNIHHRIEMFHDGVMIVLDHYAGAIWNASHKRAIQLYGHSHSGAEQMLNEKFPNRRSMDVGVDNAFKLLGEYRPFSWEEIKNFLMKKEGEVIDHHGADRKNRKKRKAVR